MFEKNDKAFIAAQTFIYIMIGFLAIISLVVGIWLAIKINALYCLIIFIGLIGCFILWIVAYLFFSLLTDVKLIRNILYKESNEYLGIGVNKRKAVKDKKVNPYEDD